MPTGGISATYLAINQFTISGTNETTIWNPDRRVRLNCGADGMKYCTVLSSTYSAPNTVVTTKESELTSNLTLAWYGIVSSTISGSLPDHRHNSLEGSGKTLSSTKDMYQDLLCDSIYLNITWDNFIDESLIDNGNSTMDFDVLSEEYDFIAGEILQSNNLYDTQSELDPVEECMISIDYTTSGTLTISGTADGTNWEACTNNVIHDFTNTGTDLRIKCTADDSGSVHSWAILYNPDPQALATLGDFIEDDAYGAGWNGDTTHAPSQNAVYDELSTREPGLVIRPKFTYVESLDFTSGGVHELVVGDTVEGETGGATGYVAHITLTGGTWAGGDAAGALYLHTRNATAFQAAETLKDNGNLNCATVTAASSKDSILISPFVYHHQGTSEQLVYSDVNIAFEFQNLAVSDWSYLYLDDSAIVTAGTNLITATELIDVVTEPAPSQARHGEYNGLDRCIMGVLTDGSSDILEFFHEGGDLFQYAIEIQNLGGDIDDTWTNAALTLPKFCGAGKISFREDGKGSATLMYYRKKGSLVADGISVAGTSSTDGDFDVNVMKAFCDTGQNIEVKNSASNLNELRVATVGYYFPAGM